MSRWRCSRSPLVLQVSYTFSRFNTTYFKRLMFLSLQDPSYLKCLDTLWYKGHVCFSPLFLAIAAYSDFSLRYPQLNIEELKSRCEEPFHICLIWLWLFLVWLTSLQRCLIFMHYSFFSWIAGTAPYGLFESFVLISCIFVLLWTSYTYLCIGIWSRLFAKARLIFSFVGLWNIARETKFMVWRSVRVRRTK